MTSTCGAPTRHGTAPVRWWVFDAWAPSLDIGGLTPRWDVAYDNDCERRKRTSRDVAQFGALAWFRKLLDQSEAWSRELGYDVTGDHTLHGGGMHCLAPGGSLNTHLDYDLHPLLPGRRRALNLILFLSPEWRPEWGGEMYLADPMGRPVERFSPAPGRLVAFEVGDMAYHGVAPVTGPADRLTAAVYYLSAAGPQNTRQRALFLPTRGEPRRSSPPHHPSAASTA